MNENIFDKLDFGPLKPLLDNDDITDISYCNGGQIWIRSLTQGSIRVEVPGCTPEFMEKLAFQCSNVMGTTFNNAKPFLDAESSELRLNYVHQSIATNGIACVIRKTPAKIRLEKQKLLKEDYFTADIHDILIKCVQGHCNIIVAGETGSGKTEFVKYLASHTKENEKIITIEDTLELHLDRIFPHRDIVAMKTNNVASYSDVLVTCMRQNPKWILLSEVRSAEAVTAVRNSISSGHNILSTIHADKASAIPYRLYSLLESDIDVEQFLTTIYRYIQLGVHIKAYYSKQHGKFHRELDEVVEFYVDENNVPKSHTIYRKLYGKEPMIDKPSPHLIEYLANQNVDITSITDHIESRPFDQDLSNPVETEKPNNTNVIQETVVQGENNISDSISNIQNIAVDQNVDSTNITNQVETDNNNVIQSENNIPNSTVDQQNVAIDQIQNIPIDNSNIQETTENTNINNQSISSVNSIPDNNVYNYNNIPIQPPINNVAPTVNTMTADSPVITQPIESVSNMQPSVNTVNPNVVPVDYNLNLQSTPNMVFPTTPNLNVANPSNIQPNNNFISNQVVENNQVGM